jgi:serine/threonine protein kinase
MDETSVRIPADFSPPGFELLSFYRKGGMAELWLARQLNPGRDVIIKFLMPQYNQDPQYTERFEREVAVQGNLGHPNIVPIYAAGEINQRRYIAMEFLSAGSLAELLKDGALSPQRAIEITIDIARALGAAHRSGYVHRDVKPDNILFRSDGRTAVLSDFGIAGVMQNQSLLTRMLVQIGTPAYMSPEQAHNQDVREPSDIYSLGVVFYEMLTGSKSLPLQGDHKPPQLPGHLQSLQHVVNRMLAFRSSDRFGNTDQLIDVLIQARIGLPQGKQGMPAKKKLALLLLAVIVSAAAIFSVIHYTSTRNVTNSAAQYQALHQLGDARQQLQQLPTLRTSLLPRMQEAETKLAELRKRQQTTDSPELQIALFEAMREAAARHSVVDQLSAALDSDQGTAYIEGLLTLAESHLRNNDAESALPNLQTALSRLTELKSLPDKQWQVIIDNQIQQAQQLTGKWTLDSCDNAITWSVDNLQATAAWPHVANFELNLWPTSATEITAIVTAPREYRGLQFNYRFDADKLVSLDKQTNSAEIFTRCSP